MSLQRLVTKCRSNILLTAIIMELVKTLKISLANLQAPSKLTSSKVLNLFSGALFCFFSIQAQAFTSTSSHSLSSNTTSNSFSNSDVKSNVGMAVTAHPKATEAAISILEGGGNAIDAAVAAAFAIPVVEPTMSSIGGRIQILVRHSDGSFSSYDGMTEIPESFSLEQLDETTGKKNITAGYERIATPGVVAALGKLHKEHGKQSWPELFTASIHLAKNGFHLLPGEVARIEKSKDAIYENKGFRSIFFNKHDQLYSEKELLKQPQLAKTLKTLSRRGADDFYTGKIAKKIARDIQRNNGFVSKKDLKNYRAKSGRTVSIQYRDREIHSLAAPAGGGLLVKTLNILENFNRGDYNKLEWTLIINQAIALALDSMNDDYYEKDIDVVTSKAWAKQQAALINPIKIKTPSDLLSVAENQSLVSDDLRYSAVDSNTHHTTHFVTADCRGNVVSITQTLGPVFGAKVISPKLGFVYASTMGSYLSTTEQKPGVRLRTTIAPTIITKEGETELILGSAGGLRILSSLVQTISHYIDDGKDLKTAVYSPRIHPISRTDPETKKRTSNGMAFLAETTNLNGWQASEIQAWRDAGVDVTTEDRYGQFGRVQAVQMQNDIWFGVTDPDWEGLAKGQTSTEANKLYCEIQN